MLPKAVWRKVIAPEAGSLGKVSRGDATNRRNWYRPKSAMVSRRPCQKPHYNGLSTELLAVGGRKDLASGCGRLARGLINSELSLFGGLEGGLRGGEVEGAGCVLLSARSPSPAAPTRVRCACRLRGEKIHWCMFLFIYLSFSSELRSIFLIY